MGQSYRELLVWQKAMDLVTDIYNITKVFPRDEAFGLTSQLRRASIYVPTNIAEGQARYSPQEFHYFLGRARGSLVEVETEIMIAHRLGLITVGTKDQLLLRTTEIGKMISGLAGSIRPAA